MGARGSGRPTPSREPPAPGKITGLTFQKRNPERVNLYIDGRFALGLPALEGAKLKVGQELSADDIERLRTLDTEAKAFDQALRFLSFRPRSIAELRRYLRDKQVEDAPADAIIERLSGLGYLDDEAFARWWVENRTEFSPRGAYALRQELRLKGIADSIIAAAIEPLEQAVDPLIEGLATERARRLGREDEAGFRRKLTAFLVRRGFSFEDVRSAVDRLWQEVHAGPDTDTDDGDLDDAGG